MPKIEKEIVIVNEKGLHIRVASEVVRVATQFDSDIKLHKGDVTIDAKSIMSLLTLECAYNTTIVLSVDGDDAEEAVIQVEQALIEEETS